jgi:23S rRNA (uracil1939-C5)-methyltransferase
MQLEAKRAILAETLRRIGKIEPPAEIAVLAAEPWHYRNRSQFHIRGSELGYLEPRSHKLCGIQQCAISSPRIDQTIPILRQMLRDSRWPRFLRSLELFTNENQIQLNVLESEKPVARRFFEWCAEQIPDLAAGALDYPAAGAQFRVSRGSFFQVNRFLIDGLVETALAEAAGDTALDLYAGAGLFSLPLARRFATVSAIESGSAAIDDLQFNAERAGARITALHRLAEHHLEALADRPDFVLADPPRAGLGKAAVGRLARLRPPRITIVSCDPATLARDLAALLAAGYTIEQMTLVDLFPQTYHLETVVRLRLL